MLNHSKSPTSLGLLSITGVSPYEIQPDEAYLCEKQKQHFYTILTRWKQYLKQEVGNPESFHLPVENLSDLTDRASQEEEFNLELTSCDRELKQISKIEKSLLRLMNDEFGYCDGCGEEIGFKRLEACPTAAFCIECQTLEELSQRH